MNTNKEGNKKVTINTHKISQKEHVKIRTQKQPDEEDKEEMEAIHKYHKTREQPFLPVWKPSVPARKTLVLDIDETLVHTSPKRNKVARGEDKQKGWY
jgi:TFIIF-interacting CTD phosphatase-like protein